MKILMLTWEYPPRIVGGIARVVHDLSHRLIKDGHDVTVVTYKDANIQNLEEFENDKVKILKSNKQNKEKNRIFINIPVCYQQPDRFCIYPL